MTTSSVRALLALLELAALLSLAACGGGGSSGGSSSPPPTQNTLSIVVDGGPADVPNIVFATVTICAPGTSNCQTIDHVQVDTGSSGLRIIASVLSPQLSLPHQTDSSGNPLGECVQFVDGFSWGPVKLADIQIAGEKASSAAIQIIGDGSFAATPPSCSNAGPPENTVMTFGANGLLGVGLTIHDCGPGCAQSAIPGTYYSCPVSGCEPIPVALAQQVQNPVALFSTDNNGVIIQMPAIGGAGEPSATGTMIFGIGTQSDNGLGNATVLPADPDFGTITTTFDGHAYTNSYIDSGSTVFFFGLDTFPVCTGNATGFYCPNSTQNLSATLQGVGQGKATSNFAVANAQQLFSANPSFNAFNDLAAPAQDNNTFAWGLSFFYGRTIYTAIEQHNTPGGMGPYFAF